MLGVTNAKTAGTARISTLDDRCLSMGGQSLVAEALSF